MKINLGKRTFSWFTRELSRHGSLQHGGKPRRELKPGNLAVGTEAEAMRGTGYCFTPKACSADFLYNQYYQSRIGITYCGWGTPTINKENSP